MARLAYRNAEDLAPADRPLLVRPVNLYRAMVNSPGMTRGFLGLANHIRHDSRLDARWRELAILQVGWVARSAYEWSHHVRIGRDFGVTDADLHGIAADTRGEPTHFSAAERAILQAAREMTREPGELADASFAALQAVLDAEALTELLVIIAFYVGVVRFLAAARIDVEEDYQPYLEAFPLPTG
jgi:alkylhydroperoxidase family enzyme